MKCTPFNGGTASREDMVPTKRRVNVGERLTVGPIEGIRSYSSGMLPLFRRLQASPSVIAPGDGRDGVEVVEVRDVAAFLFRAIDRSMSGVLNLTGPAITYRAFLDKCKAATYSDAELIRIPLEYLRKQGISIQDFPCRRSGSNLFRSSSKKAYDAGGLRGRFVRPRSMS